MPARPRPAASPWPGGAPSRTRQRLGGAASPIERQPTERERRRGGARIVGIAVDDCPQGRHGQRRVSIPARPVGAFEQCGGPRLGRGRSGGRRFGYGSGGGRRRRFGRERALFARAEISRAARPRDQDVTLGDRDTGDRIEALHLEARADHLHGDGPGLHEEGPRPLRRDLETSGPGRELVADFVAGLQTLQEDGRWSVAEDPGSVAQLLDARFRQRRHRRRHRSFRSVSDRRLHPGPSTRRRRSRPGRPRRGEPLLETASASGPHGTAPPTATAGCGPRSERARRGEPARRFARRLGQSSESASFTTCWAVAIQRLAVDFEQPHRRATSSRRSSSR